MINSRVSVKFKPPFIKTATRTWLLQTSKLQQVTASYKQHIVSRHYYCLQCFVNKSLPSACSCFMLSICILYLKDICLCITYIPLMHQILFYFIWYLVFNTFLTKQIQNKWQMLHSCIISNRKKRFRWNIWFPPVYSCIFCIYPSSDYCPNQPAAEEIRNWAELLLYSSCIEEP